MKTTNYNEAFYKDTLEPHFSNRDLCQIYKNTKYSPTDKWSKDMNKQIPDEEFFFLIYTSYIL